MRAMYLPLTQLQQEITASLNGLDAEQTQLRPTADATQWSIQQRIEHLLLTYAITCESFAARIAKGAPTRTRPTVFQRTAQYAVCKLGYFPHGRKSPAVVTPPDSGVPVAGEGLMAQVVDVLIRLDVFAREAERVFGSRRFATHHVLGPLNAHQWLRFHLIHGRHHLHQIGAIRAAHGV